MSDYMIASCEASEFLNKGDIITTHDGDYTYDGVGDFAYLQTKEGEPVDATEVYKVNDEVKIFGLWGIVYKVGEYLMEQPKLPDPEVFHKEVEEYVNDVLLTYYNPAHKDYPMVLGVYTEAIVKAFVRDHQEEVESNEEIS